jgi:hypothetical protein
MHFILAIGLIYVALVGLGQPAGTMDIAEQQRSWHISSVVEGSGAEAAGLQVGDRIVAIDGEEIADFTDLRRVASPLKEQTVPVVYERDGERNEVPLTLKQFTTWLAERVHEGSPAYEAGLRTGDQVVSIEGHTLSGANDPDALAEMLAGTEGSDVVVVYERDEVRRTTTTNVDALALVGAPGYVGIGRGLPETERLGPVEGLVAAPSGVRRSHRHLPGGPGSVLHPRRHLGLRRPGHRGARRPCRGGRRGAGGVGAPTSAVHGPTRPGLGAVDDDHQDGRRRGHAAADLRPRGAGCDIVRCTCNEPSRGRGARPDRAPVSRCRSWPTSTTVPMALAALEAGVHCLRLNPGNIRKARAHQARRLEAKDRGVPIRIGVNGGSLDEKLYEKYGGKGHARGDGGVGPDEMAYFDEVGFDQVKISVKASSVPLMIEAYRQLADVTDHPLHLGRHRGRAAAGGPGEGHRRHRHPAGRGHRRHHPLLAHRRPGRGGPGRPAAARGLGCASARTST